MWSLGRSPRQTGGTDTWDAQEVRRRLHQIIRVGRVDAADYAEARVRVRIDEPDTPGDGYILTDWLPWLTETAKNDRSWSAPEVGEQVMVLSPSGDLGQGWVLPAGFYDGNKTAAPADNPDVRRIVYDDGTIEEYDRRAHHKLIDMRAPAGSMTILTGSTEVIIQPDHVFIRADQIDLNDDR